MQARWKTAAYLIVAMGMLGGWAMAVEPDAVVPLWPGDGFPPGATVKDPQNQKPNAGGLICRMDKPELRVFLAPADRATGTAVIICPGGGYGILDYKAHVAEFVADYQQQGIAVIALLYKVPTNADLALTEGKRGIRLVRSHAKQWKIDPQKIGMQGYSAGGHLLANLISHADDGDPQAKDPLERLGCRPNFVMLMCPWNLWKVEKYPFKAPLPPVFLACAADDGLSINFSDPLAERLKELQTPLLYFRAPSGGHSAFHRPSVAGKWMEKLVPWLKQQGFACSQTAEAPALPCQQGTPHPMACADYSQGKIFLVSAQGKVEWEYPAASCNDLWALPNGNLLFVTGHGVKEVTRAKKVVFDYQSKSEIYACQRLPNGNTFIGECNAGRLLEVDPSGKLVKEIRLLPEGKDGGHVYMRNARWLPDGHYLVTHYGQQAVKEYDAQGQVVLEIPAPGGPHTAVRLPNGNTLIACGDMDQRAHVFEADKTGKTVWEVTSSDLPGISLKFMTGLERLPNGNTVMTNWLGHGHFGEAPHVIEVTPDKKVVWTFADHKTMKTISSVQLLDVPGDAVQGEVAR